jgi:hypothetical protein
MTDTQEINEDDVLEFYLDLTLDGGKKKKKGRKFIKKGFKVLFEDLEKIKKLLTDHDQKNLFMIFPIKGGTIIVNKEKLIGVDINVTYHAGRPEIWPPTEGAVLDEAQQEIYEMIGDSEFEGVIHYLSSDAGSDLQDYVVKFSLNIEEIDNLCRLASTEVKDQDMITEIDELEQTHIMFAHIKRIMLVEARSKKLLEHPITRR